MGYYLKRILILLLVVIISTITFFFYSAERISNEQEKIQKPIECFIKSAGNCLLGGYKNESNNYTYCSGPEKNMQCGKPFRSVLISSNPGRTGNCMLTYATLYYFHKKGYATFISKHQFNLLTAIYEESSLDIKVGERKNLRGIIDVTNVGHHENNDRATMDVLKRNSESWKFNKVINAGPHPSPMKIFYEIWDDLMKQFKFKEYIMNAAKDVVNEAVSPYKAIYSKMCLVGVQVRRQEYMNVGLVKKEVFAGDTMKKFYAHCMDKFRQKYSTNETKVIFIFVSDDNEWVTENFGHLPDIYLVSREGTTELITGRGLAVFSLCDHGIRSWGTYALWATHFTKGEQMYATQSIDQTNERFLKVDIRGEALDILSFMPNTTAL